MTTAVVGAARVVFGADTSDFDAAADGVEGVLGRLIDRFQAFEARLKRLGTTATVGITLPFAAMVRSIDKGAGAFEGQMKRVEAALDGITGDQLEALSDQARRLGPEVGKGATDAAEGIENLALAGVSAADILGGGLKATLDLAAAGMVEVAPAASLVTDVMGQFHKTAEDLPDVVRNIVGAMDASKFSFDDFRYAIGQGGAVAAAAGVELLDYSSVIAATSAQFTSGSDAGTSFRTYLQSLTPNSEAAKRAMKALNLEFFDAQGRMKPLAEQAQMLQDRLRGLTEKSRQEGLETIFGADGIRTALGLMEQGAKGFERFQAKVAGGDVEAKIAKRLEGSAVASERISHAWESVKISIGETGLLDAVTGIKNRFAQLLEAVANAPAPVLKIGTAIAALTAAMGPLLFILGNVAAFLLARFVSAWGLAGRALALILSPVSTIIAMLGEAGLVRVIGMLITRLLGLAGPVGWAIGAFLLFKDTIVAALTQVWDKLVATLGPPLSAIIGKVQGIFASLAGGPIGSAFGALISLLSGLADVIGTVLGGVLLIFGELLVRTLNAAAQAISGFLDMLQGMVDLVSALLTGDFAGAWEAVKGIVEDFCDATVDAIVAMVPDIEVPLRAAYGAAKAWLADGFSSIGTWVSEAVGGMIDYVGKAFPNVVAAAKSVYTGVRAWLVEKFGGILDWIGRAAKWVGDKYQAMKERLGLGGAASAPEPPKPDEPPKDPPVKAPATLRSVSFDDEDEKKKRARKGRDTTYDADNREQLKLQAELEAARLRNDQAAVRALEDRIDRSRQIEAYQRTGLSLAEATKSAERDLKLIEDARAVQSAKEIADDRLRFDLRLAEISGNGQLRESLERQEYLQERIDYWLRQRRTLTEATALATAEQMRLDGAVEAARERAARRAEDQRQIDLARARGDSEDRIRIMEREAEIKRRTDELVRGTDAQAPMDEATARAQAETEAMQMEMARRQGLFRDTIKGGFRAALDGNLGDWLKNWWKDRVAKGMEEALNSLADKIEKLFAKFGDDSSGGDGGLLSSIGKLFGGGSGGGSSDSWLASGSSDSWFNPDSAPGFKTGGSFKVGGRSGIDRNLVAFRATAGEMVNITRPGQQDAGPMPVTIHLTAEEGALFRPVVRAEAAGQSVRVVTSERRTMARKARQRLAPA
jgi:TP901 family phage tail tape measure protein